MVGSMVVLIIKKTFNAKQVYNNCKRASSGQCSRYNY